MASRLAIKQGYRTLASALQCSSKTSGPCLYNSCCTPRQSDTCCQLLSQRLYRFSIQRRKKHYNEQALHEKKYFPRRAMMYVPGCDVDKIAKIHTRNVDTVVLDCEDGVAHDRKDDARETIAKILQDQTINFGRSEVGIRPNSIQTEMGIKDLKTIMSGEIVPELILLPKVETREDIEQFSEILNSDCERHQNKVRLVFQCESALGLVNLQGICERAKNLSEKGPFRLEGIMFGSDDFCADIGATRTDDAFELILARQKIVLIAKLFRLQAIDMVHIKLDDLDGLRRTCIQGARMGFTGKQVIHPKQVPIVQEVFSPTQAQVEWASGLLRAFEEHQRLGKGAFVYNGSMVDMPTVLQARNVVRLAALINQEQNYKVPFNAL